MWRRKKKNKNVEKKKKNVEEKEKEKKKEEEKSLRSFGMSRSTNPATERHIPEEWVLKTKYAVETPHLA